jgi:ribonucleotide reductase beta subunit family protein with ferritin-like domain
VTANRFIQADETLHYEMALTMLSLMDPPGKGMDAADSTVARNAWATTAHTIISGAVDAELTFVRAAFDLEHGGGTLPGLSLNNVEAHVKYTADQLLKQAGLAPLYHVTSTPCTHMVQYGMISKTNFFEQKATEYADPEALTSNPDKLASPSGYTMADALDDNLDF